MKDPADEAGSFIVKKGAGINVLTLENKKPLFGKDEKLDIMEKLILVQIEKLFR